MVCISTGCIDLVPSLVCCSADGWCQCQFPPLFQLSAIFWVIPNFHSILEDDFALQKTLLKSIYRVMLWTLLCQKAFHFWCQFFSTNFPSKGLEIFMTLQSIFKPFPLM